MAPRERAGGGDPGPQAGEAARACSYADAPYVLPADLGLDQCLLDQRLQRLRVARALAGRRIVAALDLTAPRNEHRDRRGRRRRVDADDRLHGSISILRWSPPAWASRTRCATRPGGRASSSCSGHSTNAIVSSPKKGSSKPGSSPPIPASL